MPPESLQSYHRFMREYLFDHVDVPEANVNIPDGTVPLDKVHQYCQDYERRIKEAGPERKLVAFVMEEKAVPRHGMPIAGGGQVFVKRPFEGLASECDVVAMRELVPAAGLLRAAEALPQGRDPLSPIPGAQRGPGRHRPGAAAEGGPAVAAQGLAQQRISRMGRSQIGERGAHPVRGERAFEDRGQVGGVGLQRAVAVDRLRVHLALAAVRGEGEEGVGQQEVEVGQPARLRPVAHRGGEAIERRRPVVLGAKAVVPGGRERHEQLPRLRPERAIHAPGRQESPALIEALQKGRCLEALALGLQPGSRSRSGEPRAQDQLDLIRSRRFLRGEQREDEEERLAEAVNHGETRVPGVEASRATRRR